MSLSVVFLTAELNSLWDSDRSWAVCKLRLMFRYVVADSIVPSGGIILVLGGLESELGSWSLEA